MSETHTETERPWETLHPQELKFSIKLRGDEGEEWRKKWPKGPWDDEPDKVVWVDEETDLDCMVHRNQMGAWCGYVGVGPDHPLHHKGTEDHRFDVHGGLTYADHCLEESPDGLCHIPLPGRPEHVWWLGFDCHHWQDLSPGMLALEEHHEGRFGSIREHASYKNISYVIGEVQGLAKQVATYGSTREDIG